MLMGGLHKHHGETGLSFRRMDERSILYLAPPTQVTFSFRRQRGLGG